MVSNSKYSRHTGKAPKNASKKAVKSKSVCSGLADIRSIYRLCEDQFSPTSNHLDGPKQWKYVSLGTCSTTRSPTHPLTHSLTDEFKMFKLMYECLNRCD